MSGRHVDHPVALRELTVARVTDVGPRLRRITFTGDQLGPFHQDGFDLPGFVTAAPDDHVKVFPPPAGGGSFSLPAQADGHLDWPDDHSVVHRDYTVRRYDADAGELDIEFVLHEGGAAATWAAGAEPGATLHVAGPRSSFGYPAAAHVVMVGDLTALPAIARWTEEAPAATALTVVVRTVDASDRIELRRGDGTPVEVRWVDDPTVDLGAVVAELPEFDPDVFVFVAAELSDVAAVRRHLRDDRGLAADRFRATSYWRRGGSAEADHEAEHAIEHLADLLTPFAVRVAASLRLADHVVGGASTTAEVAAAAGADPVTVDALLRHLAGRGVFAVDGDRVSLTGPAAALVDDHPSELRRRLDLSGAEGRMHQAWSGLLHTATTGEPGYEQVFGAGFWDDLHSDPALASSFDGYLARWATVWVPRVRAGHDWARYAHVVDVGGGMGLLLAELLHEAPDARGTIVELPTTAATAAWWFEQQGVADRAATAPGSFFDSLPSGDAVVLAQVLHDWPDDDAVRILARAAEALTDGGRVVLVERLRSAADGQAAMTLLMRNLFAGTERDLDDFAALAGRAGLAVVGTSDLGVGLHLIELEPRP